MTSIPSDFTIATQRLHLRAASTSDVEFIWSATRFEGFNNGLTWNAPNNKSELIAAAIRNQGKWEKGESFMFTSELSESKECIGRTGISRMNYDSEWGFGFWVHPDYWNRGYATEAGSAVLSFGFSYLRASKISAAHAIWNTRSKKVIEKLGFGYMRENPCGFVKNGKPIAEYEYEISQPAP